MKSLKSILLFLSILFLLSTTYGQVVGNYNLLIVQGTLDTDAQTELTAMGHTITIVPSASLVIGYNYAPFDAIIFMYDSNLPPGISEIISLNESCQLGIIAMRGQYVISTAGLGNSVFWNSTNFSIDDNTHWITQPFALGLLDLGFTYKSEITSGVPGTTILGSVQSGNGSLVVHDTYRRVVSPYYGHTSGMPWSVDGEILMDRIIAWASFACCANSSSSMNEIACDSYTAPSGAVHNNGGVFIDHIPNAVGCDSAITINLTLNNSTASTITEVACDTYNAPSGAVHNVSGIFTDSILNVSGCDSVITINLTINNNTASTITEVACDTYISPSGAIHTVSGTFNDIISNAAGCDSSITIILTINTVDNSVVVNGITLSANDIGAVYQWFDCTSNTIVQGANNQTFTPQMNGNYAVIVTKNGCTDTSVCKVINTIGIGSNSMNRQTLWVYPNPNNGEFTISSVIDGTYTIVNTLGQSIQHIVLNSENQFILSISNLSQGVYYIIGNDVKQKIVVY